MPFVFSFFSVSLFLLSPFSRAADDCRVRGWTIAYDIEVQWDEKLPTKVRSLKLVYALGRVEGKGPLREQPIPLAVATVQLPPDGIEVSAFVENRFTKAQMEKAEMDRQPSRLERWAKSAGYTSYIATLGISSPLEVINPPAKAPDLRVDFGQYGKNDRFSFQIAPRGVVGDRDPIPSMNISISREKEVDDEVTACLYQHLRECLAPKIRATTGLCSSPSNATPSFGGSRDELFQTIFFFYGALVR